jgi:hypothetical protein
MTLVVTTASKFGISLIGDRAVSRMTSSGQAEVLEDEATKIFYSDRANIGLAYWGKTKLANGTLADFAKRFLEQELDRERPLLEVAEQLATQLMVEVEPLHRGSTTWADLSRGVHVSGFVNGEPHIYHVHMGTAFSGKAPEVHQDFPNGFDGGQKAYSSFLEGGGFARLFNGFSPLYDVVGVSMKGLREQLEKEFAVQIPAPKLGGQVAFERSIVRLCADLLLSSDRAPQVGAVLDTIAFTARGRVPEDEFAFTGEPLLRRATSNASSDVTASPSILSGLPLSSAFKTSSRDDGPNDS